MPDADYARTMARYTAWQNENVIIAADGLDDEARQADRGAFFGSIAGTLNHLLWGDRIWMSRFAGTDAPETATIPDSVRETASWQGYALERRRMDRTILDWTAGLDEGWFAGDLTWWSGAVGREVTRPKSLLLIHFFNHGTHHRGQVHAMLTAAGADPGDTDMPFMP